MAPRGNKKPKETAEEKAARKAVLKVEKKVTDLTKATAMQAVWTLINNPAVTPETIADQVVSTCGIDCKYLFRQGGTRGLAGNTPLQLAIMAKRLDVARVLVVSHSANVESRDSYRGVSALRTAIKDNNLELVRLLVDDGQYDLRREVGSYDLLPLHFAMEKRFMPIVDYLYSRCPLPGTLQYAIGKCKDIEMVQYLLSKGCNVNEEHEGKTALSVAISFSATFKDEAVALVLLLLNSGAKLEAPPALSNATEGFTLLHLSGQWGWPSVTQLLIDLGLPINALDSKGRTPFATAIENHNWANASLLINSGADVNISWQGTTALHLACRFSQSYTVQFLLNRGANVNAVSAEGETPLTAITKDFREYNAGIAVALLQHGADPNIPSADSGETPLHRSIPEDIAQLLIEKGANINAIDNEGNTPLLSALWRNRKCLMRSRIIDEYDLVDLLVTSNADLTIINNNGDSAANYFAELPTCAVKALLDADRIGLDTLSENGITPLQQSYEQGNAGKALMCIEYGANTSGMHFDGRTALYSFCRRHDGTLMQLVDAGAEINDIEAKKATNTTPLMEAMECRNRDTVLYLLANGADYLTSNEKDETALHLAAFNGYLDIVNILVAQGAPINSVDTYGRTPLKFASYSNNDDVFRYLLENGGTF